MDDNPICKISIHLQTNLTANQRKLQYTDSEEMAFSGDGMKKSIKRRFQEYLSNQVGFQTERGKNQFFPDCLIWNCMPPNCNKNLIADHFHTKQTYLYNYPNNYWDQQTFLCVIQFTG